MDKSFRKALKKDFNALYVKKFSTDWVNQRLIRGIEIDIMAFKNVEKLLNQKDPDVGKTGKQTNSK